MFLYSPNSNTFQNEIYENETEIWNMKMKTTCEKKLYSQD